MTYERLLSYGNIIQLNITCDVKQLISELQPFTFKQYNSLKLNNRRYGLSVTSLDGEMNGEDLESLYEQNMKYNELMFNSLTDVYYQSKETRKLIDPFKSYIGRSHFLSIKTGGYFPPHRDDWNIVDYQHSLRIIVPISECTPPNFYYIFNGEIVHLKEGYAYFMNTNLEHSVFSFSDNNLLLVMNVESRPESYKIITNSFYKK